jgi:uncharacterized membrane protein YeaQ/YmgE (transglycosylase-associated protein family)
MFSILVWVLYGLFVGAIAKAIVPGEERMGFIQTMALGVAGSYLGGAVSYLIGNTSSVSPAGILMGIGGGVVALLLYKKVTA